MLGPNVAPASCSPCRAYQAGGALVTKFEILLPYSFQLVGS